MEFQEVDIEIEKAIYFVNGLRCLHWNFKFNGEDERRMKQSKFYIVDDWFLWFIFRFCSFFLSCFGWFYWIVCCLYISLIRLYVTNQRHRISINRLLWKLNEMIFELFEWSEMFRLQTVIIKSYMEFF